MKKSGSMKSMIVAIADRRWSSRGQRDFIALALNFEDSSTFLYVPSDSARFSFSSLSIRFPLLLDFFAGLFLVLDALATLNHTKGYKSGAFPGQLIQQEISLKWNKQISCDGEQFETNTAPANCIVNASRASYGIPVDSPLNRARPRKPSAPMHRWFYILFFSTESWYIVAQKQVYVLSNCVTRSRLINFVTEVQFYLPVDSFWWKLTSLK